MRLTDTAHELHTEQLLMDIEGGVMIYTHMKTGSTAIKVDDLLYLEWNRLALIGECYLFLPGLGAGKMNMLDRKTITIIAHNLASQE